MQIDPRSAPQRLVVALRSEFDDVEIELGDSYVARTKGTIDPLGGASLTVHDGAPWRVQLMPSLADDELLLAACECTSADDPACDHLWAALRVIDGLGRWPRRLAIPTAIDVTDPDDPDLELIDDRGGAPIAGAHIRALPSVGFARVSSSHSWRESIVRRSWRELVLDWPRQARPATGKLATVEYALQVEPVAVTAMHDRRPGVDDRACVVCVATVTGARTGASVRRRYASPEPARLSAEDLAIQTCLFGVEELVDLGHRGNPYLRAGAGGRRPGARIAAARAPEILGRLAATGRFGWLPDRNGPLAPLSWDGGGAWELEVTIARASRGRARVTGALVRDGERIDMAAVVGTAGGGIVVVGDRVVDSSARDGIAVVGDRVVDSGELARAPVADGDRRLVGTFGAAGASQSSETVGGHRVIEVAVDGLARWLRLFAHEVELPTADVAMFIERTCDTRRPPKLELGDVGIELAERSPECRLVIAPEKRSFRARAELAYDGQIVDAAMPSTIVRARGKKIVRRRLDDEHAAALAVRALGGELGRDWTVAPARLRELVEAAAAAGIEVYYEGGKLRSGGAFSAIVESGIDWFDLSLAVDVPDADVAMPELLAALRTGRPLVRLSDGTTVLIPPWLERRAAALVSAPREGQGLRFRKAETLLLASLLDGISEVEVDAAFAKLRDRLDGLGGMTPCDAPAGFGATLRDYQRDGLGWLRFLQELGLGGCLADDMGLGKTVQVLALLEQLRKERRGKRGRARHKPSLVVAPRSLVFHWLDEARRFAPELATLEWHGLARAERAAELATADLIVTTYATLRLDQARLAAIDYAVVVLDEAHAIKNATTATAQVTRALRADHRLALTGTPVENRLDDLASIFDFLNPGLLGRPAVLRALGDASGDAKQLELAHARALGRVLRPFLLRRTKEQVLTELPAKTEVVVTCRLEGVERRRYDELREHYRRALLPAVERDGVGRNAILVLEALLRLRQAALHPGLLDSKHAGDDSAKLDALVERLTAAMASGHRALVFSQFTTLLGIVSARLEREGIAHEYLDGKTRDRRERVAAFQTGATPVFLLSLKAGGTGLNLTAADHVFLLDPWWNPAVERQAIDRVHRIGQGRPVTAYRLVAEDTVEAKILTLQAHKRAVFDSVFEDNRVVANLSTAELRALLD